jgi:uncharacterized protein (TIGR02118 family)
MNLAPHSAARSAIAITASSRLRNLNRFDLTPSKEIQMSKLIALYRQPADPTAFDQAYFSTHMPLIAKVPGLLKTTITRFTRNMMGENFYMMAEMEFADMEALKAGMKSPEMAAAGDNLMGFAAGLVTLLFGEETV